MTDRGNLQLGVSLFFYGKYFSPQVCKFDVLQIEHFRVFLPNVEDDPVADS